MDELTDPAPDPHGIRLASSGRIQLARALCRAAVFLLPACIIATPWNMKPFAVLLLATVLLTPDLLWDAWRSARHRLGPLLVPALLVVAVVLASRYATGVSWSEVDNRTRVLAMPLCALVVIALRPERIWFWSGAVAGLACACAVVLSESFGGALRPGGWTNPIVFADVALGMMVVAAFCRPPHRASWVLFALLAGTAAILVTGSRGAWPGMIVVAIAAFAAGAWRLRLAPRTWIVFACLLCAVTWIAVPKVSGRIDALQSDAARYDRGDSDTSLGARLDLVDVAGDALRAHPWFGVGVGNFGGYLHDAPICRGSRTAFCRLGHAHSDLPEWAATMGLAGLVAILLLYGLPFALFAALRREAPHSASAAQAGMLFVATFVLSGLTQSMFAHQLTASFYPVVVGLLAGYSLLERPSPAEDR